MASTAEPIHKMAATTTLHHVTAAIPVSCKVKAVSHESSQVTAVFPEPIKSSYSCCPESNKVKAVDLIQVTADFYEPNQVTADLHEASQATTDLHEPKSQNVTSDRPESRYITFDCPESRHVTTVVPEPRHVTAAVQILVTLVTSCLTTQSHAIHVSSDLPEPRHVSSVTPKHPSDISRSCHPLLLFPVTIWCVWAPHYAPEASSVHEWQLLLQNLLRGRHPLTNSQPVLSRLWTLSVNALSILPAKEVLYKHSVRPVTATEADSEPLPCSELAKKAISEFMSCLEAAILKKNDSELLALSVVLMETVNMPTVFPDSLFVALSAFSVPVFLRSQSMSWVSVPPWWASALSALPWWASSMTAPPWRAPGLPAPPWWAPAPTALPRRAPGLSVLFWWPTALSIPPALPWFSALPVLL
ncbi:hypothetical protein M9458_048373, partial [Cirrhinus mrigala]